MNKTCNRHVKDQCETVIENLDLLKLVSGETEKIYIRADIPIMQGNKLNIYICGITIHVYMFFNGRLRVCL